MKKLGFFLSIAVFGVVFAACSGTTETESDVMVKDDAAMMEETPEVAGDDAMMIEDDEYKEDESYSGDTMMKDDATLDVEADVMAK